MNKVATHNTTHQKVRGLWLGKEKWKCQLGIASQREGHFWQTGVSFSSLQQHRFLVGQVRSLCHLLLVLVPPLLRQPTPSALPLPHPITARMGLKPPGTPNPTCACASYLPSVVCLAKPFFPFLLSHILSF